MTTGSAEHPHSSGTEDEEEGSEKDLRNPWLPDASKILSEETITSPKGRRYRILETKESDPYDELSEDEEESHL
jgi:hypothetical protein